MAAPNTILFVTSNPHKAREAQAIIRKIAPGVRVQHFKFGYPEPRAEDVAQVARSTAAACFKKIKKPLFVEDAGLFIPSLNGFPGVYSKDAFQKLGIAGMLRLLASGKKGAGRQALAANARPANGRRLPARFAVFRSAIGFADARGKVTVFVGECPGMISLKPAGRHGFGFDPIFVPNGGKKTFAQDPAFKERVSHRRKALERLARFLIRRSQAEQKV